MIVLQQLIQVVMVCLYKGVVHKIASFFTAFKHQVYVIRRYDYASVPAHQVTDTLQFFAISLDLLAIAGQGFYNHLFGITAFAESAFKSKKFTPVTHYKLVTGRKIAFAQAEVIDGVKDIGLAHAIGPCQYIKARMKNDAFSLIISELCQLQGFEMQRWYYCVKYNKDTLNKNFVYLISCLK